MRFYVEQSPQGAWRVMLRGATAPVSVHDTEEEARERLAAYIRGVVAATSPTTETGLPRGDRVKLRDGGEVIVRPIQADDKPLLLNGFEHFSEQSRYQRFLGFKKRLSASELKFLTEIDHSDHEALGALEPDSGRGVGIARFIRERPGGPVAEAAVAVVDDYQGRGLGGALLDRLVDRAADVGVREFSAELLVENRAMLALFARLGRMEVRHDGGSTAHISVCVGTDRERLHAALKAAAEGCAH